jgi:hypothetical protein
VARSAAAAQASSTVQLQPPQHSPRTLAELATRELVRVVQEQAAVPLPPQLSRRTQELMAVAREGTAACKQTIFLNNKLNVTGSNRV